MYCLCFRFNTLISKPSLLPESSEAGTNFNTRAKRCTKNDLEKMIAAERVFITQKTFCVLFSTNCFFGVQGEFLMRVYQAFALQIQDKIRLGDYQCLFGSQEHLCDNVKAIINELFHTPLPNLRNMEVVINLQAFKRSVLQVLNARGLALPGGDRGSRRQLNQNSRLVD